MELPIKDNQFVKKGDLLMKIDPRTFQANVAQCKASLAKARAAAAEAKDMLERARHMFRLDKGSISQLSVVAKENALLEKKASVAGAKADLQTGSNTVANQPALALIDSNSFWVFGFFKETQIKFIQPGDRAVVKLMSYPDRPIEGVVESIGRGIAQQDGSTGVDLLPSINASFDWIRLAQRIPVIIELKALPPGVALRVGTTATVIVMHPHGKVWGTEYLTQWEKHFQPGKFRKP